MRDLTRLFNPKSIAVFGGAAAELVVTESRKLGFEGELWPVHPKRHQIGGEPCVRSIGDLPGIPDAAFVGVNRDQAVQTLGELSKLGCGGAVVHAAGFDEVGEEGQVYTKALVEASGDMPVIGPNCLGAINYLSKTVLWCDIHGGRPVSRGVALITQSGAIAQNITMLAGGMPLAYLINLGNQVLVNLADCIETLSRDDGVSVIAVHLEGVNDLGALDRALRTARDARKPVLILKSGRSEMGASIAGTHTAAMTSSGDVFDAFLARNGAASVDSIVVLIESAKLLHTFGPLSGINAVGLGYSGGEASLLADASERWDVEFKPFSQSETARIRQTVRDLVTISNPFDFHILDFFNSERLRATFAAVAEVEFDFAFLVTHLPARDKCDDADFWIHIEAFADAMRTAGRPAAIISQLPEGLPAQASEKIAKLGLVTLLEYDHALAAVTAAAEIGRAFDCPPSPSLDLVQPVPSRERTRLNEWQGKQLLAQHGVSVPEARFAESPHDAVVAAEELGFPLVCKAVGEGIAHKTEMNAVRLNLENAQQVCEAADDLLRMGDGVLIETMVRDAVCEYIVGVANDPAVGLHMIVGSGGILTELLKDRKILLFPFSRDDVRKAIESLRSFPLIDGYRGKPRGDLKALIDVIMSVQALVTTSQAGVDELDINPVMVRPAGHGAVAADALISMAVQEVAPAGSKEVVS